MIARGETEEPEPAVTDRPQTPQRLGRAVDIDQQLEDPVAEPVWPGREPVMTRFTDIEAGEGVHARTVWRAGAAIGPWAGAVSASPWMR